MFRRMISSDSEKLQALYARSFGTGADTAEMAVERLSGEKYTYVAEENGAPIGMLLPIPVVIGAHAGVCFAGLAVEESFRGHGVASGLLAFAAEECQKENGMFAVLVPYKPEQFAYFEKRGFAKAFPLRRIQREIKRNIWSQAEFDSTPAKKLCDLRRKYCPNGVQIGADEMIPILTDLYSRGITIVSSDEGFGLYFREGETLRFIEIMADGDRAAECLMEAAREKEVVVEKADIVVGADQNLFLGEGRREDHGMIRFFTDPFDISESGLRLILDID